jgi:hypothetical protein
MALYVDARVPVVFGALSELRADDALLIDGTAAAPDGVTVVRLADPSVPMHVAGCVCCVPRSAAGAALSGLFLARGRGDVAFFRRVLAVTPEPDAIRTAVEDDLVASSWFRLA